MPKAGGTTARGLGHAHQQDKRRLLTQLVDGTPCPLPEWCGGAPMIHPDRCTQPPDGADGRCFWCRLQRDHSVPRALGGTDSAGRLAHAYCNLRAGSQLGNQRRWGPRRRQRQPW